MGIAISMIAFVGDRIEFSYLNEYERNQMRKKYNVSHRFRIFKALLHMTFPRKAGGK